MLRVATEHICDGMQLAVAVFNPRQPDHVLLKPGYELNAEIRDRLTELRINQVFVRCPALDEVGKYIRPEMIQHRATLAGHLVGAFNQMQTESHPDLNYHDYVNTINDIVELLIAHPASGLFFELPGGQDSPVLEHSLRVTYLAVLMGVKLDSYLIRQRRHLRPHHARDVRNLGLGAMMHDIGLLQLPDELQTLDEPDHEMWREHVRLGLKLVGQSVAPSVRAVVFQHHQAFDGTGWPVLQKRDGTLAALIGEQIHVFARIVAAAKMFDMLCDSPDGRRQPVAALRAMLEPENADKLDPVVLEVLFKVTPPFPPGCAVTLSDGRTGVVVSHNVAQPCRPRVHLFDEIDHTLDAGAGAVLDLNAEDESLFITRVDDEPVTEHLFELPDPTELITRAAHKRYASASTADAPR